jgi:septum formation protein
MGFDFKLIFQDSEESYPENLPVEEIATYLAKLKADSIANHLKSDNEIILTCDTTVICEGVSYEKPKDRSDAVSILKALSGKTHYVMTAVCLKSLNNEILFSEKTYVSFMPLTDEEIDYYIDNYAPYDKAEPMLFRNGSDLTKSKK